MRDNYLAAGIFLGYSVPEPGVKLFQGIAG